MVSLFDGPYRNNLLPFTYTRPVAELRIGMSTIREKWEHYLSTITFTDTEDYLIEMFPAAAHQEHLRIHAACLPNLPLIQAIQKLTSGQKLVNNNELIAYVGPNSFSQSNMEDFETIAFSAPLAVIRYPWDLFLNNPQVLKDDFEIFTHNRTSSPISSSNRIVGNGKIFIEQGASVECAVLNTEDGPIYIGKNAKVMEGALIRGSFFLGENSIIKMGTKIYGGTTIGPNCKVGGEVNNSIVFGYSNKAHDGFIGNAVVGEWCNIGAATDASNLKNNYDEVRAWSYPSQKFIKTSLQFCGLLMADHSRCSIHTMFNTATVVGVSANIFGTGFPRTFIPSFSWGGAHGFSPYNFEKAIASIRAMKSRKSHTVDDIEENMLRNVFEQSSQFRTKD